MLVIILVGRSFVILFLCVWAIACNVSHAGSGLGRPKGRSNEKTCALGEDVSGVGSTDPGANTRSPQ